MTIQKLCILPTESIYCRFSTNYYPIQHSVTGFYNRDRVCLLRGTNRIFNYIICIGLKILHITVDAKLTGKFSLTARTNQSLLLAE